MQVLLNLSQKWKPKNAIRVIISDVSGDHYQISLYDEADFHSDPTGPWDSAEMTSITDQETGFREENLESVSGWKPKI